MVKASKATDHRANRLLAALAPQDYARLVPSLETVQLARRTVLYESGDAIRYAYFPHDCIVSLVAVMQNGDTVQMAVFGREGVLGFASALATGAALGRYVVQLPGTASRMTVAGLREAMNANPGIRNILMRFLEALIAQTFQTVACNAVHRIEARCCRWILSTHDRIAQEALPLTHEFLAEMLGVQRSSVSAVTRSLQSAGLIVQGRGVITVGDRAGLETAACECYGVIRRSFERCLPATYRVETRKVS
ncbi:MAG: Crp/Fnr family transcriptional regulator [Microvirga sp.]